jgi:hypothetical protein
LVLFFVGASFSLSGTGSTVATGFATGFGGGIGAGGAAVGLGSLSLAIANMTSPIPSTKAAQISSTIVAYRIVLSVLQTAMSV